MVSGAFQGKELYTPLYLDIFVIEKEIFASASNMVC